MTREAALEAKKDWGNAGEIIGHQRRNDKLEFRVALPRSMESGCRPELSNGFIRTSLEVISIR